MNNLPAVVDLSRNVFKDFDGFKLSDNFLGIIWGQTIKKGVDHLGIVYKDISNQDPEFSYDINDYEVKEIHFESGRVLSSWDDSVFKVLAISAPNEYNELIESMLGLVDKFLSTLNPERLKSSRLCFVNGNECRFSFSYDSSMFCLQSGNLLGDGSEGLTCATFVLAFLNSFGIHLIDSGGWITGERNKYALKKYLKILRKKMVISKKAKAEMMKGYRDRKYKYFFIKPEHVFVSSLMVKNPARYDDVLECVAVVKDHVSNL